MHGELIQFNSGDHVLGNKNVTEAVITDGDIVFNESYVVIGESLEAKNIHATYDLDVVANIAAVTIIVNGNLYLMYQMFIKQEELGVTLICGSFRRNIKMLLWNSLKKLMGKRTAHCHLKAG